jgi:hypothetical protein
MDTLAIKSFPEFNSYTLCECFCAHALACLGFNEDIYVNNQEGLDV